MSTTLTDIALRRLLHDAILDRKRTGQYIQSDFELEQTYYPWQKLSDIPQAGKVWVISLAADDTIQTRGYAFKREYPVQIGLQKVLDGDPRKLTQEIDTYRQLEEQLRDTLREAVKEHRQFGWMRTEALKDENGTPFHFTGLREQNTFEAFFTAYYTAVLE